jgi:ribulose-phosphate 3-epimerase
MVEKDKKILSPSLLSSDFGKMAKNISMLDSSQADWIHFDIMDGVFVPNISFGYKMLADLRSLTKLTFDTHLMIKYPGNYIEKFADAGADIINIHLESNLHLHRMLTKIRKLGKKPGITIVPSTPVHQLAEILALVDLVLVMTVNPGFGGQVIIDSCLEKVRQLKEIKEKMGYNFLIEVDGGINRQTIKRALNAGADVFVIGSAIFKAKDPKKEIGYFKSIL